MCVCYNQLNCVLVKSADYSISLFQFIVLCNRYLLLIYSVLDIGLGTGDTVVTNVHRILVVFTFIIM